MTQSATLPPDVLRRVRRDPRFRSAAAVGVPADGWRARAACLGDDPELFFPTPAEDPSPALAVCAGCAVQGDCLAAALGAGECDGVWGGTTPDERRTMRHAWTVGAPRRVAAR